MLLIYYLIVWLTVLVIIQIAFIVVARSVDKRLEELERLLEPKSKEVKEC